MVMPKAVKASPLFFTEPLFANQEKLVAQSGLCQACVGVGPWKKFHGSNIHWG